MEVSGFDMKRLKKKKWIVIIAVIISCAALMVVGFMCYGKYQMGKIPGLSFAEALAYTTKDNPDVCITVGTVRDGQISWHVYGENGRELPAQLHTYEIGSLTKTFTAALVNKAVSEGKIKMDDTIDLYLTLPDSNEYPTIKELLTHTSGYKGYYFENPMVSNFFHGRNDFYGITKEMVLNRAGSLDMDGEDYSFTYSNYGYAVLGLVLEAVYDTDYATLANDFIQNELGLENTRISDRSGDLGNYWDWAAGDAYLSAGALTSDISDMLSYARMQLADDPYFILHTTKACSNLQRKTASQCMFVSGGTVNPGGLEFNDCHQSLEIINASTEAYQAMGIRMDEIGMAWIIDRENGIIWHNGGTGDYNCYLGFHPETRTAVVVLSNLAPNERIPATVLGVKLLTELTH